MAKGPPTSATVFVAAIALTDYNFPTDRGTHSLPAWRMHLRDVTGDIYVLAVSPSAPYELPSEAGMYDAGRAVRSADGRRLTINFIAHHDSTGPCDPGYSSSLRVAQPPTAIVHAVTIAFEPETPPPNVAFPRRARQPSCAGTAKSREHLAPALLRWRSRLAAASWSTIVALPTSSVLTDPGIVTRRLAPPFGDWRLFADDTARRLPFRRRLDTVD